MIKSQLFYKILFYLVLIVNANCKPKNNNPVGSQDQSNIETADQSNKSSSGSNEIWISSYGIGEDGGVADLGEIRSIYHHTQLSQNLSLSTSMEPNVDSETIEFAQDSSIILGRLINGIALQNLGIDKVVEEGCYSSAVSFVNKIFYLDPFKDIEPLITNFNLNTEINFTGIICLNEKGFIIAIASNNILLDKDRAINDFIEFLESNGMVQVDAPATLQLVRFANIFKKTVPNASAYKPLVKSTLKPTFPNPRSLTREPLQTGTVSIGSRKDSAKYFLGEIGSFNISPGLSGKLADGSEYTVGNKLGAGTFGDVYEITISRNGISTSFALKKFKKAGNSVKDFKRTANSPFFLQNYGFSPSGKFQLSELGGKTISREFEDIKFAGQKTEAVAARGDLFHDLFDGLSVLHGKRWYTGRQSKVHWDLKPDNLLRGLDGRVKIIDLDDVSIKTSDNKVGSQPWAPPERLAKPDDLVAGTETDIFASGIMLLHAKYAVRKDELFSGVALRTCCDSSIGKVGTETELYKAHNGLYYNALKKGAGDLPQGPERLELELIADMINPNPKLRPSIKEVKLRWTDLHPRPQKALSIAKRIFGQ